MGIDSSIYDEEGEEKEDFDVQKFLINWGILIIASIIFVIFRNGQTISPRGDYDLLYGGFVVFFLLAKSGWVYMKHKSPKLNLYSFYSSVLSHIPVHSF